MLKESIKRKIIIATLALIIFIVTLTFPKTEEKIKSSITYQSSNVFPIYLLDNYDYVARTTVVTTTNTTLEQAKELINYLTINNSKESYLPSIFTPVIPRNTKVLDIDLQDTTLKINFSKEFLNVKTDYSEKMIECLVYSLTEIEGIDGIIIYVEEELLEYLPNTNTRIPSILTRDIGINKIYDIDSYKGISKTTTYYVAKEDDYIYYVPVTLLENNDKDKVEIIIERLKTNTSVNTNLTSYLSAASELSNYEILEDKVILSFTSILYEGLNEEEMTEVVKYSISLSIKDTLNIKEVEFQEKNDN